MWVCQHFHGNVSQLFLVNLILLHKISSCGEFKFSYAVFYCKSLLDLQNAAKGLNFTKWLFNDNDNSIFSLHYSLLRCVCLFPTNGIIFNLKIRNIYHPSFFEN